MSEKIVYVLNNYKPAEKKLDVKNNISRFLVEDNQKILIFFK